MKYFILSISIWIGATSLIAQTAPDTYWVQFTDKANTPFSLLRPEEFLSQRSIERRNRYGIELNEMDLPIDPTYIDSLKSLGLEILCTSKWFNSATIRSNDSLLIQSLSAYSFIRQIKSYRSTPPLKQSQEKFGTLDLAEQNDGLLTDTTLLRYGQGSNQIGMLNGHILHNQGFQGQGMLIAILDAGFNKADVNIAFDSLWQNGQIKAGWDFVNRSPIGFDKHNHGAQVLSVMGANLPGQMVGSAPKASFLLIRTEDGPTEYLVEEDYWVSGAEFADSAGADLINSSLGYSRFLDPATDHSYTDMDGNSTRITIGADLAAARGILVVTSAANEGNTEWHYITAPADADSVLTVGAVDSLGQYAYFSSTGPTYDRRIKPNVSGQGASTALVATSGAVIRGNGTSFSSPLICGLTACLWQSNRTIEPFEIIKLIEQSASQQASPDSLLGYGLPDFGKALFLVQGLDPVTLNEEHLIRCYPNPFTHEFMVDYYSPDHRELTAEILSLDGKVLKRIEKQVGLTTLNRIVFNDLDQLPEGILLLRIITDKKNFSQKIIHRR